MKKKSYITPLTEEYAFETLNALCTSTMPSASPGSQGGKPNPMGAPAKSSIITVDRYR